MTKYLPLAITLTLTLISGLAVPQFVASHATLYALLNALAQVLHAILPSLGGANGSSGK